MLGQLCDKTDVDLKRARGHDQVEGNEQARGLASELDRDPQRQENDRRDRERDRIPPEGEGEDRENDSLHGKLHCQTSNPAASRAHKDRPSIGLNSSGVTPWRLKGVPTRVQIVPIS